MPSFPVFCIPLFQLSRGNGAHLDLKNNLPAIPDCIHIRDPCPFRCRKFHVCIPLFGFADPVYLLFDLQVLFGLLRILTSGINSVIEVLYSGF